MHCDSVFEFLRLLFRNYAMLPQDPLMASGGADPVDDQAESAAAKRRRTAAPDPPLKAAERGANAASTKVEVAFTMPQVRPATLGRLVMVLGLHERDLRDRLLEQICNPRYLAVCADDLPQNPAGALGTFAVTVPMGTTAISWDAFTKCKGLKQVSLPATVSVVEEGWYADQIRGIKIDDNVGAFSHCSSLVEIKLPPDLAKIGACAFAHSTSLVEITLPPNITEVEADTFAWCTSLAKVTLPTGLTRIEDGAFCGCSSLAEITLPRNLTEIEQHAFQDCTSLTEITLPPSLTEVSSTAFVSCGFDGAFQNWLGIDNWLSLGGMNSVSDQVPLHVLVPLARIVPNKRGRTVVEWCVHAKRLTITEYPSGPRSSATATKRFGMSQPAGSRIDLLNSDLLNSTCRFRRWDRYPLR